MSLPRHAEHGVVGPTGFVRPGPRAPKRGHLAAAALLALLAWSWGPVHQPTGTEALFTSRAEPQRSAIEGGTWTPDPPAACGPVSDYAGVVYGTLGDDVLRGGNRPQIIMGLGGNDTIYGGNSGDCLVGGAGDDHLVGGNGKDILLGGPGDDFLDGGNAKDYLDGEDDADECDGGNGNDDVVNCDAPDPLVPLSEVQQIAPQPTTPGVSDSSSSTASGTSGDEPAPANTAPANTATDQPVPAATSTEQPALEREDPSATTAPEATP